MLPSAQRAMFNSLIISNAMQAAIIRRDQKLAMQGTNFARATWSRKDCRQGIRTYGQNMLPADAGEILRAGLYGNAR